MVRTAYAGMLLVAHNKPTSIACFLGSLTVADTMHMCDPLTELHDAKTNCLQTPACTLQTEVTLPTVITTVMICHSVVRFELHQENVCGMLWTM